MARRRIARPSIGHADPSSITKSQSTAAVSGRQGSRTTVPRSATAENFGKPLSKLLHGERVISSPPRNDITSVLTPVPVAPRPLATPATLPRRAPLISGISIWMTRPPCSRSRSPISPARAGRGWTSASDGMAGTLLASQPRRSRGTLSGGRGIGEFRHVVLDEDLGRVPDPLRVPDREVDHQRHPDGVPDGDDDAREVERVGQRADELEQLDAQGGEEAGHEEDDAEDREQQVLDHVELAAALPPEVGDAGDVHRDVDRQDGAGDNGAEQREGGRRRVLLAEPEREGRP